MQPLSFRKSISWAAGATAGNRMEIKKKKKKVHGYCGNTRLSLQFWFEPDSLGGHWSSCGNFLRWNETPPGDRHGASSTTAHGRSTPASPTGQFHMWSKSEHTKPFCLFRASVSGFDSVRDNDMETEESRWGKKIFAAIILKALRRPNKMLKEKRREATRQGETRGGAYVRVHALKWSR